MTVNVEDHSSSVKSAPRGTILVAKIKLNPSESVDLDSISLKRTGLSSQTDIAHVRLEKNGVAVTNSATVSSDNLAVLNFKSNLADIEKAQTYDLIVEVASNAEAGAEFAFVIQDVKSSATAKINEDTTTTYRVGAYTVVNLVARAVAKQDDTIEYTVGNQKDYVIGEFSLESDSKKDDRDVNVKSITFRNMGSLDFEETFKNVKVYRDSKDVSSDIEINGKDITVSLGKDEITANKKAIYTIRAEVANLSEIDKNVQLQIRSIKDIIADESETEFRTTIEFDPTGDSLTLNSYKFKGGKITLEGDSSFAKSVNASTGASDVVVAKGTLTIAEPIELPTIKFDLTKDNDEPTYKAVKRITLDIDGRSYRADNQSGAFTFSDITVKKDADIKVLISLESKIGTGVSKIVIPDLNNKLMEGSQGTYTNSDESFASTGVMGSIDTADVYVKAMKFSITTDTVNTQETVIKNSSTKTLMKGKFSVKDANVNINNLKVSLSDGITLDADESLEVYVYTNGESFSNGTITSTNTGFNFNSLGTISSDKDMSFEIRVKPYINTAKDITLSVIANGTTSDGNDTVSATETSATLEVKGNATIEVTTTSKTDRVVEPTSSVVIYEGEINVKNGSSTLTGFKIAATAGSDITLKNYKLYVDGDIVATEDTPSFTTLNENLEEGKRIIQVKADVFATG
ncbi:MAG: hypothetical protein K6E76_04670 [Patescibacteria group bacterium]|nr:hypothetical protein [Patescibacteria group bacterium]